MTTPLHLDERCKENLVAMFRLFIHGANETPIEKDGAPTQIDAERAIYMLGSLLENVTSPLNDAEADTLLMQIMARARQYRRQAPYESVDVRRSAAL